MAFPITHSSFQGVLLEGADFPVGLAATLARGAEVYWHVVPLVLVISLVYSATRHERWPFIVAHAFRLALMILGFMAAVIGVLLIAPLLPGIVWVGVVLIFVATLLAGYVRPHRPQPSSKTTLQDGRTARG